jgi:hypothetical protein
MIDAQIKNTSATCCWSIETQEVDWRQRFTSRVESQVVDCIIMHPRKTGPLLQAVDRTLTMLSYRVRNPDIGNADSKTSGTIACTPRARSPALGRYSCFLLALGDAGRYLPQTSNRLSRWTHVDFMCVTKACSTYVTDFGFSLTYRHRNQSLE